LNVTFAVLQRAQSKVFQRLLPVFAIFVFL
jgi:hypothetical protein